MICYLTKVRSDLHNWHLLVIKSKATWNVASATHYTNTLGDLVVLFSKTHDEQLHCPVLSCQWENHLKMKYLGKCLEAVLGCSYLKHCNAHVFPEYCLQGHISKPSSICSDRLSNVHYASALTTLVPDKAAFNIPAYSIFFYSGLPTSILTNIFTQRHVRTLVFTFIQNHRELLEVWDIGVTWYTLTHLQTD